MADASGKVYEHLEYFPFGETWVQESSNTQRTPYLFTAKELDEETGLYYFGARYYDPRTSVWQSPDPILGKYLPSGHGERDKRLPGMGGVFTSLNLSLYTYSHQNPVTYLDPDGRLTIIVHGTGASNAVYAKSSADFNKAVSASFKEAAVAFNWSGANTVAARREGAAALAGMINRHEFAPGEKLNIVAHSHGGNLVKAYTGMPSTRKIDTLVNLGTPQRDDFQINVGKVNQYLNVFSTNDAVQSSLGGYTDITNPITNNTTRMELGSAGRQDPAARNIEASTVTVPGRLWGTRTHFINTGLLGFQANRVLKWRTGNDLLTTNGPYWRL